MERSDIGDRLIDFMVALESLLGNGKDSIADKVARRLALLTAGPGSRKDVFRQAKQAYDLRSRIVHGDQGKVKDDNSIFTVTAGVGELLRMCVLSLET